MSKFAKVRALNPSPWFPLLKPRFSNHTHTHTEFPVDVRGMFYLPGVFKQLDGRWMKRCVLAWLDTLDEQISPDTILDAHFGYPEGVGSFLAARERNLRVFITIRGLEVDLFHQPKIRRQLVEALNGADGVIAVSESLRLAALKAGVKPKRIEVIPNGVDTELYHCGDQEEARLALGIPLHQKTILCVGNLKRVKGHDVLIEAFSRMPTHRDTQLVCLGAPSDPSWLNYLEKKAHDLGVANRVRFLGSHAPREVALWLRASNVFALASRREGCCNAVLESLATGTPVVSTEVGDNPSFVKEGTHGFLSPPGAVQPFAANLALAFERSWDSEVIRQSVRDHTWQRVARQVLDRFALEH